MPEVVFGLLYLFFVVSLLRLVCGVLSQCADPADKVVVVKEKYPDNEYHSHNKVSVPDELQQPVRFEAF